MEHVSSRIELGSALGSALPPDAPKLTFAKRVEVQRAVAAMNGVNAMKTAGGEYVEATYALRPGGRVPSGRRGGR